MAPWLEQSKNAAADNNYVKSTAYKPSEVSLLTTHRQFRHQKIIHVHTTQTIWLLHHNDKLLPFQSQWCNPPSHTPSQDMPIWPLLLLDFRLCQKQQHDHLGKSPALFWSYQMKPRPSSWVWLELEELRLIARLWGCCWQTKMHHSHPHIWNSVSPWMSHHCYPVFPTNE